MAAGIPFRINVFGSTPGRLIYFPEMVVAARRPDPHRPTVPLYECRANNLGKEARINIGIFVENGIIQV